MDVPPRGCGRVESLSVIVVSGCSQHNLAHHLMRALHVDFSWPELLLNFTQDAVQ